MIRFVSVGDTVQLLYVVSGPFEIVSSLKVGQKRGKKKLRDKRGEGKDK
jgi:hypothetical protein